MDQAGIIFDPTLLAPPPRDIGHSRNSLAAEDLERIFEAPDPDDLVVSISASIGLDLLDRYPRLDRVSQRAGMAARTLHGQPRARGTCCSKHAQDALRWRALVLPRDGNQSVTDIGAQLGYEDAAHFTRALERWAGMPPASGARVSDPGEHAVRIGRVN